MEGDRTVVDPGVKRRLFDHQEFGDYFDRYELHAARYQYAAIFSIYRKGAIFDMLPTL
jgi:hypothetical protein